MAQFYNNATIDGGNKKELIKIADQYIPNNSPIKVAYKGVFKEYLFLTDFNLYIIKKGSLTGNFLGASRFKMPYSNITDVQIKHGFMTAYMEVSTPASKYTDEKPEYRANCLTFPSNKSYLTLFNSIADFITTKINLAASQSVQSVSNNNQIAQDDDINQIRKYKTLFDEGILTKEEFDAKKKQILNLK